MTLLGELSAHIFFEIHENPDTATYVIISGIFWASKMKSGWWLFTGWLVTPFALLDAVLMPIYLMIRFGWAEAWNHTKDSKGYERKNPKSPLVAARKAARRGRKW